MDSSKDGKTGNMEIAVSEDKSLREDEKVIEVEPDIMVNGKTYYKIDRASTHTLVIHCGDPRFQTAFRRFITEELGIASYTPLVIGGGIHAIGMKNFLPKNFKILWEQIKFHIKERKLDQVIIINHEDCDWYDKMKGYYGNTNLPLKGKLDLKDAALTILNDFVGVNVRTFWAALEDDRIVFSEVK